MQHFVEDEQGYIETFDIVVDTNQSKPNRMNNTISVTGE